MSLRRTRHPCRRAIAWCRRHTPKERNINGANRLVRITDESGFTEYEYGKLGEVVREKRMINMLTPGRRLEPQVMEYKSDYLGRMQEITYPDGDVIIPFFDSHEIPVLRILTDRGSEYCGNREHHEYALYLELENIEHSKRKARSPQSNGICKRFNKTCKDEFYSVAFRKKVYRSIDEIQLGLNEWIWHYNNERTHSGKYCYGKTPMQMFINSISLAKEKLIGYDVSVGQLA